MMLPAILGLATLANPLPSLSVKGRYLVDSRNASITLHGYMQPGDSWFNGEGRNFVNPKNYADLRETGPVLRFYNQVADILSSRVPSPRAKNGFCCTYVRFIGDGTGVSNFGPGWDVEGKLSHPDQFAGWLDNIVVPYINHCQEKGLYVVLVGNPSEQLPVGADGKPDGTKNMSKQYQENLITFWQAVAKHPLIKNAPNVQFEICNEPISIESEFGRNDWKSGNDASFRAITAFMQPVVNAIRSTGANNVIWVPGLGWQGEAQGWAKYPVKGRNVGYSAHFYPAYGGVKDDPVAVKRHWESNYKPAADIAPMLISEIYWNPNSGKGYEGLWNAHTDGFGNAVKAVMDAQGNVSYNLGMVGDFFSNLKAGLNQSGPPTAEATRAALEWYPSYLR